MNGYRLINILSLDIVLGAVASALFFFHLFNVPIDLASTAALGLAVFLIYSADHLLDARKVPTTAGTIRHQFYQQYFRPLLVASVVALVLIGILVMSLPLPAFLSGSLLGIGVVIYLLTERFLTPFKEFVGAMFYTVGILIPSVMMMNRAFTSFEWVVLLLFLATAWINLSLFALFDIEFDLQDGHKSIATLLGVRTTHQLLRVLLFITAGTTIVAAVYYWSVEPVALLIMQLIYGLILEQKERFLREDRFRLIGDGAFMVLLIVWLS